MNTSGVASALPRRRSTFHRAVPNPATAVQICSTPALAVTRGPRACSYAPSSQVVSPSRRRPLRAREEKAAGLRVADEPGALVPHPQVRRDVAQVQVRVSLLVRRSQPPPPGLRQRKPRRVPARDLPQAQEEPLRRPVVVEI